MPASPLLDMIGISKSFPGVQALRNVDLTLQTGEVLAVLGENGAGKSTLIKVLAGAVLPDAGTIKLDGRPALIRAPQDALRCGIAVIHQEFNLVPALSARDNIFLGQESSALIARRDEQRRAREMLLRLGLDINPETPCRELTIAQQQVVEIARALVRKVRILVLDEPTAALTSHETERLFAIIRDLKARGIGVIYISHRLEEIFALADRVMVLRDGANVGSWQVAETTRGALIERMVGRTLQEEFPPRRVTRGAPRLSVRGLQRGRAVRDVSFDIASGEVLGLTGLVGAGRTETARLIFGADRRDAGEIYVDGRQVAITQPRDAIRAGIGLLTEDRKGQGLILDQAALGNFSLPNLRRWSRSGFVQQGQERAAFAEYVDRLDLRLAAAEQPARQLSGGNQQKLVLAKWLARRCEVLLFDEPTRGVDVGAKVEIYRLINDLAAQGKAVLMISSELPEVLGMADRILVMHEGRIRGEIGDVRNTTPEQVMTLAMGEA